MQGASVLFSEMTPPPGQEQRFHDWYDKEHIPLRMDVPGFVSAQRYRDLSENAKGFLAVYEMSNPSVMKTPAYQEVKTEAKRDDARNARHGLRFHPLHCR